MAEDNTYYDFSEYPLDHPLYSATNRKAIGFFKDELNSVPMQLFVGLRPKYYAFLRTGKVSNNVLQHINPVEKKTAKEVKRRVKDAHLHFAYYLDTLNNFHTHIHNLIKSTLHTVRTVHMCKVGLSAYDTKRWLCEDAIHTHAHGHRSLSPRRGRGTCSPQVKYVVKVTLIIDYFEILKFYVITFDEYGKFF